MKWLMWCWLQFVQPLMVEGEGGASGEGGEGAGGEGQGGEDPNIVIGGPGSEGEGGAASGGEGEATGEGAAPPQTEEVTVNGTKMQVTPEQAQAIRSQQEQFDTLQQQLNDLSSRIQQQPSGEPTRQQQDEAETLLAGLDINELSNELFTDTASAIKKLARTVSENTRNQTKQELSSEYQVERAREQFWNDFYKSNDDLQGNELIVDAVVNRDMNNIKDLPPAKAAEKIADAARQELVRLTGKKQGSGQKAPPVEPGGGTNTGSSSSGSGESGAGQGSADVVTLSQILRKRQSAKRQAG